MSDDSLSVNSASSCNIEKKKKRKKPVSPHVNDIVSGRGSGSNRHEGNLHFRKLIRENKQLYLSRCKNEKMLVARDIFDSISSLDPPGRFLQKNPETGTWFEIGKDRALEKISQALREKNSKQHQRLQQPLQPPTVPLGHIDQAHHRFAPFAPGLNRVPHENYSVPSPTRLVNTGSNMYSNMMSGQPRIQPPNNISDRMAYLAHELRQADERLGSHDGTSLNGQMLSREAEMMRHQTHQQQLQQQQQQRNMLVSNNFDYSGLQGQQNAPPIVQRPSWYYDAMGMPPIPQQVSRFQSQNRPQSHLMSRQMHPFAAPLTDIEQEQLQRQRYLDAFGSNMSSTAANMNMNIQSVTVPGNPYASISTPAQQRASNIPFVTPEQLMNASVQQQRFVMQQSPPNDGLAIVDNSALGHGQTTKKKKKKGKKKRLRPEEIQIETTNKKSKKRSETDSPPSESLSSVDSLGELSPSGLKKEQDSKDQPRDDCNARDSNNESDAIENIGSSTLSTDSCTKVSDSNPERKESPKGGLEALSQAASLYRR